MALNPSTRDRQRKSCDQGEWGRDRARFVASLLSIQELHLIHPTPTLGMMEMLVVIPALGGRIRTIGSSRSFSAI